MQGLSDKIEGQTAATLRTIPSFFALLLGLRQLVQAVLLVLLCISGSIKKLQRAALDISRNTITQSVVMFEDAHGKSYRIQTDFITNWRVSTLELRPDVAQLMPLSRSSSTVYARLLEADLAGRGSWTAAFASTMPSTLMISICHFLSRSCLGLAAALRWTFSSIGMRRRKGTVRDAARRLCRTKRAGQYVPIAVSGVENYYVARQR